MLKYEELNSIKSMVYLCELEHTTINGVELDYRDFGIKEDVAKEIAEPYGCGNMLFIPHIEVEKKILDKYNITKEECRLIQAKLSDCLSFGMCGWCV